MPIHSRIALFSALMLLMVPYSKTQPQSVPQLFQQIQAEATKKDATEQLLKIPTDNAEARKYLAFHLPALIQEDPKERPRVWMNEVRLAGAFKITEAIPALSKWIGLPMSDSPGGTLTDRVRLEPFPAGRALVQIGQPAVPTLTAALERSDWRQRWVAYRALDMIGTPTAMNAIREHVDHEPDETLKSEMRHALGLS